MPFKVTQATFDDIQKRVNIGIMNTDTQAYVNASFPLVMSDSQTIGAVEEAGLKELERLLPIAVAEARSTPP